MLLPSIPPNIPDAQAGAFALRYMAEDRLITRGCLGYRFALFFSTRLRAERFPGWIAKPEAFEWIEVIPVTKEFVAVTQQLEMINFLLGRVDSVRAKEASCG